MLINTVQPAYAFINSNDGVVASDTLNILKKHCVNVLQTHLDGAIKLSIDKQGITSSSFFHKAFK